MRYAVCGRSRPPEGFSSGWLPAHRHTPAFAPPFTLHAATRAGALDLAGREAPLRYVLRPPLAQERLEQRPDGLVRITLKKAYSDGTIAVDMDPLSLLCRLATSVPPPRFHTVRYAGVLAAASPRRSPSWGPPYWKSQVLRRQVLGDEEDSRGSHGHGGDEAA
jgi:hypothetical protein